MSSKKEIELTTVEKFNQGIIHQMWKGEKTLRAEAWFKRDSHSRYMEKEIYHERPHN